jgi:hypothetical protein
MILENTINNKNSSISSMKERLSELESIKLDKSNLNIKLTESLEENNQIKNEIRYKIKKNKEK